MPKVSIVMPAYNRETYLAESINSILNQTHKDFELIIVDDGSTDSSRKLYDYYVKKDKRVKVVYIKNSGISVARNTGVEMSKGEYIAVMDSDDIMHPKRLEKSLKAIQKVDFVYSSYYMGDNNCQVAGTAQPPVNVTIESIKQNSAWPHVTLMAKRKCFIDNPYRNDFKVNDDAFLIFNLFKRGYKNKMIKEPLVIQRGHWGNTSRTKMKEIAKTQVIMNRLYKEYEKELSLNEH